MQTTFRYLFCLLCLPLMWACSGQKEQTLDTQVPAPEVSDIPVSVKVRHIDQELFALKSKAEIEAYLIKNPELEKKVFLQAAHFPERRMLVDMLWDFVHYAPNDTLYRDCRKVWGDFSEQKKEIEQAFRYMKYYYPDFKEPEVYTMVSGFGHFGFGGDMLDFDNFIVVGLDYFAGEACTYRPPEMPNYLLRRYRPQYMVPFMMRVLTDRYNKVNVKEPDMLNEMIAFGKAYYATKRVLPHVSDTLLIGYTGQELANVQHNEANIWAHFVKNELFYEKNRLRKGKYCGERPHVNEIDADCPGRIGQWLGWKLVHTYMERHPETTLPQLMAEQDARKLFEGSRYRPAEAK